MCLLLIALLIADQWQFNCLHSSAQSCFEWKGLSRLNSPTATSNNCKKRAYPIEIVLRGSWSESKFLDHRLLPRLSCSQPYHSGFTHVYWDNHLHDPNTCNRSEDIPSSGSSMLSSQTYDDDHNIELCCVTDTHSWNNFILNSYSRLPRTLNSAENKILRHGCSHDTVNRVYELPFQIKNDIKITMFRFKVVENMLATKASLFRTQICDCNVCPQCLNTLF